MGASCSASSCGAANWHNHTTMQSSCGITNVGQYATTVFGPYVNYLYQRVYADDDCTHENYVLGRRLYDGHCISISATSSFNYALRMDTSVQTREYNTANCSGSPSSVFGRSSSDVQAHTCIGKSEMHVLQLINYDPLMYTTTIYYKDASCTTPNRIFFDPISVFTPYDKADCQRDAQGLYLTREQYLTSDVFVTAKRVFGSQTTYMVKRGYYEAYCFNDQSVSVYLADGQCINRGAFSGVYTFDSDRSAYLTNLFLGSTCNGELAGILRLDKSYIGGGVCTYNRKFDAVFPTTPAPRTPEPETPSPTPVSNLRPSSASSIAFSIAAVATLVAAAVAPAFLA